MNKISILILSVITFIITFNINNTYAINTNENKTFNINKNIENKNKIVSNKCENKTVREMKEQKEYTHTQTIKNETQEQWIYENKDHNINNDNNSIINNILKSEDISIVYEKYKNYEIEYNETIKLLNSFLLQINNNIEVYKEKQDTLSVYLFKYYSNLQQYNLLIIEKVNKENLQRTDLELKIENKIKDKLITIFNKQKIEVLEKIEYILDLEYKRISLLKEKTNKDILKLLKIKVINNVLKENINNRKNEITNTYK